MKKTKLSEGGIVVALCCAVYFISYLARLDYSAVMAEMIARNVLDKEGAGLIGTALFLLTARDSSSAAIWAIK